MKQLEYKMVPLEDVHAPLSVIAPGQDDRKRVEEGLNYFGRAGWDFIAIIPPYIVFKRELEK